MKFKDFLNRDFLNYEPVLWNKKVTQWKLYLSPEFDNLLMLYCNVWPLGSVLFPACTAYVCQESKI